MTNDKRDELLRDHGEQIAKHMERFEHLKADFFRLEKDQAQLSTICQVSNDKLVSITGTLGHLETRVEELRTRRWELVKLLLAALLGVAMTKGYESLIKRPESPIPSNSNRGLSPANVPSPDSTPSSDPKNKTRVPDEN